MSCSTWDGCPTHSITRCNGMEQQKHSQNINGRALYLASNESAYKTYNNKFVIAPGTLEHSHFMLWQGICFLWGPSGSIATDMTPNPQSADEIERSAAAVVQKQVQTAKKTLSIYLHN